MSKKRLFRVPNKGYGSSFDNIQNIGGLVLALDYRYGVYTDTALTTPAAIGQGVGGWRNRATDAYHATQATAANKPILAADGLQFDGTNDYLGVARMTGAFSAGFSCFAVASLADGRPAANSTVWGGWQSGVSAGYFNLAVNTSGVTSQNVYQSVQKSTNIKTFADGATAGFIASATASPTGNLTGYFDGTQAGTPADLSSLTWASIANATSEAPYIAALSITSVPSNFCACTIKSLIIYNRPLTTSELTVVHRYLGAKYAITVP